MRRKRRGRIFALFFAGGYGRYWPPPASYGPARTVLYYLGLVGWTINRCHRPRYAMWLARWAFTIAALIYLAVVIVAIPVVIAAHLTGWSQ